jgi:hypothetical protein
MHFDGEVRERHMGEDVVTIKRGLTRTRRRDRHDIPAPPRPQAGAPESLPRHTTSSPYGNDSLSFAHPMRLESQTPRRARTWWSTGSRRRDAAACSRRNAGRPPEIETVAITTTTPDLGGRRGEARREPFDSTQQRRFLMKKSLRCSEPRSSSASTRCNPCKIFRRYS